MMGETQFADSNLSRGNDAIVLSRVENPRPEFKTDLPRSDTPSENTSPKNLTPSTSDIFFKTKLCHSFTIRGSCAYGDGCTFAHGMDELRISWEAGPRVCKMYLKTGKCTYGASCNYMHVERTGEGSYVSATDRKGTGYKTNPCFTWRTTGRCSYGAQCRFIHGAEDSKRTGADVEAEGNCKPVASEGSSRSKSIFSFKPMVVPSREKKGPEKLKDMKKIVEIYGDWLE